MWFLNSLLPLTLWNNLIQHSEVRSFLQSETRKFIYIQFSKIMLRLLFLLLKWLWWWARTHPTNARNLTTSRCQCANYELTSFKFSKMKSSNYNIILWLRCNSCRFSCKICFLYSLFSRLAMIVLLRKRINFLNDVRPRRRMKDYYVNIIANLNILLFWNYKLKSHHSILSTYEPSKCHKIIHTFTWISKFIIQAELQILVLTFFH